MKPTEVTEVSNVPHLMKLKSYDLEIMEVARLCVLWKTPISFS